MSDTAEEHWKAQSDYWQDRAINAERKLAEERKANATLVTEAERLRHRHNRHILDRQDAVAAERERCASLAEEGCLDIGCTAIEAEGAVRRTRNAIAITIRAATGGEGKK